MLKGRLEGQRYERLEILMPAWVNEKNQQVWMCVCDCKQIRFITTAQWKCRSRKSCGCLRREVTRAMATKLNTDRAGQPRSEKGKLASQAACKKMNAVRHSKARHILDNVDPILLTGFCHECGLVPIKRMQHRVGVQRDQYLCWVGSLRQNDAYANAKVRFPNHALEMWNTQNGDCAICVKPMEREGNTNIGATLDHCHDSGYIRGFLHQGCNKGLGHFLDDPATLRKAAAYLESALDKQPADAVSCLA